MSVVEEQLRVALDILWEYPGATIADKARSVIERVDYLRRELSISQYNERAAHAVIQQDHAELFAARAKLRYAKIFMEANDPHNARFLFGPQGGSHDQQARQASGTSSAQQERTEGGDNERPGRDAGASADGVLAR